MKIENTRTFTLPQTGGRGLWAITICGVVGVAFGVVLMRKGKSGSLAGAM
jgi:LPXTG-motif cell wall-anchored protein